MASGWLYGAVKRAYEAYGFKMPADKTLVIKFVDEVQYSTGGGFIGPDGEIVGQLILSRDDLLDTDGNPRDVDSFENTLAHEMTHVLVGTYQASSGGNPLGQIMRENQWLNEGFADYTYGANMRVRQDNVSDILTTAQELLAGS
jgi:hypothetical protein